MTEWRHRLYTDDKSKKELFSEYFIICKQLGHNRLFASLDSKEIAWQLLQETSPEERTYYEVFGDDTPHRPYFDLDIKTTDSGVFLTDPEEILRKVIVEIASVVKTLKGRFDLDEDLRVYSSTTSSKASYHIVLTRYVMERPRQLFDLVTETLTEEDRKGRYLDTLYKSVQQFRLLSCHKYGELSRTKTILESYTVGSQVIVQTRKDSEEEFYDSLVSRFPESLEMLVFPSYSMSKNVGPPEIIYHDIFKKCVHFMVTIYFSHVEDFPFIFVDNNKSGNLICLKNKKSYICPSCKGKRFHEHENPYVYSRTIFGYHHILFNCRRTGNPTTIGIIAGIINQEFRDLLSLEVHKLVFIVYHFKTSTPRGIWNEDLTELSDTKLKTFLSKKAEKEKKASEYIDKKKRLIHFLDSISSA